VIFGPFGERGEASDALGSLPAGLKQFRPYVRTIDAVREEVRRAPVR
jgi:septal ring-binding cell division protein DamX